MEVVLGCHGIRKGRERHCFSCVDGGIGTFVLPESVAKRIRTRYMNGKSAIDIINKLNKSGKIPRCPKGGKRFATGTTFGW